MSWQVRVRPRGGGGCDATDLVEANVGGLLTEALTADVQAVLADETGLVGADAAVERNSTLAPPFLTGFPHFLIPLPALGSSSSSFLSLLQLGVYAPFAAALAVGARARVPDRLVRHIGG